MTIFIACILTQSDIYNLSFPLSKSFILVSDGLN